MSHQKEIVSSLKHALEALHDALQMANEGVDPHGISDSIGEAQYQLSRCQSQIVKSLIEHPSMLAKL